MEKTLEMLEKYLLYIVLGLFAFFVLPFYSAPYVIPKEELLIVGVSLLILVWVAKIIVQGKLKFNIGKFDLGVLLIAGAYLASTILATPNKMEAFLLPGTTTFVLAAAVLYFIINQFDQKTKSGSYIVLFISVVILALISMFASLDLFSKVPQLPAFVKDVSFNPLGGIVPSIILMSSFLFLGVSLMLKEKDNLRKIFYGVSLAVILFGIVILIGVSLPGKPLAPRFATTQDSWEVAVEALKKSPLVGAGPANYLTAFNLFRPVTYNASELWQVRFTTASNFYFTLITETGFIGLFALAVLLIAVYKYVVKKIEFETNLEKHTANLEKFALLALVILFALLPTAPTLIVFLFVLLALVSSSESKTLQLNVAANDSNSRVSSRVPAIIVGLPFVVAIIAIFILGSKVLAAEATFKNSLDALSVNDAKSTYDLMNKAINLNPAVDRYHASFAQVNMALATTLANKKDISDNDRSAITQLVQQAISEGKATVSLNPTRSGNWEVLAQIYRSVMPFAQGADQFTIQTYSQAIALDPTNPNLRIALGGVFYSLGKYDNAVDTFKLAVLAKPDLANAHYNLAIAYREKKDYDNAIAEMQNVISLVNKNSQDYTLATKTLAELQKNKSNSTSATQPVINSDNLSAPQPQTNSNIKPPIELPKEATPPATPKP